MKINFRAGAAFCASLLILGISSVVLAKKASDHAGTVQAPRFEVDPLWPKTETPIVLPITQSFGSGRAGSLEAKEIYAAANPPAAECCTPAPPVLAFDQAGNLIASWGGPGEGYDWPDSNHGITVGRDATPPGTAPADGATRVPASFNDNMVLKFTQSGKFLMQIGHPGKSQGSNDVENLKGPAKMFVDPKTDELYVADGYGNHRVIVFDAETGKYKRHWGAYGNKPDDTNLGPYKPEDPPAQQFRNPVHCAQLSNDGLLYVCDRPNDRIQVFKPDGTFVKEVFIAKNTRGDGSVWDIAFFSIAADSKGNICTMETYRGQRVQKFVYKGLGAVAKKDQGVVWPKL